MRKTYSEAGFPGWFEASKSEKKMFEHLEPSEKIWYFFTYPQMWHTYGLSLLWMADIWILRHFELARILLHVGHSFLVYHLESWGNGTSFPDSIWYFSCAFHWREESCIIIHHPSINIKIFQASWTLKIYTWLDFLNFLLQNVHVYGEFRFSWASLCSFKSSSSGVLKFCKQHGTIFHSFSVSTYDQNNEPYTANWTRIKFTVNFVVFPYVPSAVSPRVKFFLFCTKYAAEFLCIDVTNFM